MSEHLSMWTILKRNDENKIISKDNQEKKSCHASCGP